MLDGDGDLQGLHPVVPDPGTLLTSRVNWDGTKCIIIYCIYIYIDTSTVHINFGASLRASSLNTPHTTTWKETRAKDKDSDKDIHHLGPLVQSNTVDFGVLRLMSNVHRPVRSQGCGANGAPVDKFGFGARMASMRQSVGGLLHETPISPARGDVNGRKEGETCSTLVAMASNLLAMAFTLVAWPPTY